MPWAVLILSCWQEPAAVRVQNARAAAAAALEQGRLGQARHELRNVLRYAPADLDAWEGLHAAAALSGDTDGRLRAVLGYAAAAAGANGQPVRPSRLKPAAATREAEKLLAGLPRACAAAAQAVLRAGERLHGPDDHGAAVWHLQLALEIARELPAVADALAVDAQPLLDACALDPVLSVRDIGAAIEDAASEARVSEVAADPAAPATAFRSPGRERSAGEAVLLARALAGLAAQARHGKGKGVPEGFEAALAEAGPAMSIALGELRARLGRSVALEELAGRSGEQRALANTALESWTAPAVAQSPRGWYRVETTCGLSTLEATAQCVEKHHQRLADWMGVDPFAGRPGLVRMVPRGCDLDAEGAPFWWAGGFQGGDVTTLRFAMGTRDGIGRGLTHELTHRFDGALWTTCPGWAAEGRACWTAAAYHTEDDAAFIADFLPSGSFAGTLGLSYGDAGKLRTLVDGTLEEYRDNYTAGTALWSYLYQAKDSDFTPPEHEREQFRPAGVYLYRERIERYLRGAARDGLQSWFELCFADGQDGRPPGMDAFAARFRAFLEAFLQAEPPAWTRRFAAGGSGPAHDPPLYDRMSWPNDHWRCPPSFGEEHAGAAGEVLAQRGNARAAIRALEWGRSIDGPSRTRLELLAAQYAQVEDLSAAFLSRAELRRLQGGPPPATTGLPASFRGVIEQARGVAGKLEQAAVACAAAGAPETALWLRTRAQRVALAAGLEAPIASFVDLGAAAAVRELVNACPPPRALALDGWEVQLRGEEKTHGPWHESAGSLVLGFAPAETPSTGQVRSLPRRPVFVRARAPMRGRYSFRAEVVPLTPYVAGELIAGFRGGNRYLRFGFSFGSEGYAMGISPVEETRAIRVACSDQRERDSALWGGARDYAIPLAKPRGSDFTLAVEVFVDGPDAAFYLDGELAGVLHTADHMPIEGFVGFAVSAGAARFLEPQLQEHAGWRGGPRCPCLEPPAPWNPAVPSSWSWETMIGRVVAGVDLGPHGTLFAYVPDDEALAELAAAERTELARYEVEAVGEPLPEIPSSFQPQWAVVLPQALFDALDAAAAQRAAARRVAVLAHPRHPGYELWRERSRAGRLDASRELIGRPDSILIYADEGGIIRAVDTGEDVERWLKVMRGF